MEYTKNACLPLYKLVNFTVLDNSLLTDEKNQNWEIIIRLE